MSMKPSGVVLLSVLGLFAALPAWAENSHCEQIGGVVMTNIGAIAGVTNLGPAFGDLQGAVAATILGHLAEYFGKETQDDKPHDDRHV